MAKHPEHLAHVTSAPTELEAGIIVAALERAGIEATMSGVETAGFRVGVPGQVEILVAEADLPGARRVMAEAEQAQDTDEGDDDFDVDFDDDSDEFDEGDADEE